MKTFWIIAGVIVLVAIIYWLYKKNKTETIIVSERKREPIPSTYAFRTIPDVVYYTNNGGGKNVGSESVLFSNK